MKIIQTLAVTAILGVALLAQESPTTTPGTGGGRARAEKIVSPEVQADNRVTFRLLAPKAAEVLVQGNWEGGRDLAMSKNDSGLWSVTTSALDPELWAYTFSVDGVRTLDPSNYNVARDGTGFMNTLLVLGDVPDTKGNPVQCLKRDSSDMSRCTSRREPPGKRGIEQALRSIVTARGHEFATLHGKICPYDPCPVVQGNTLVWRSKGHLSAAFARKLTPTLRRIIAGALD